MHLEIIKFWFEECEPKDWYQKNLEFDNLIREKFQDIHGQVVAGEHADWRSTAKGRLAEIVVLDQFSRNMFRDTAKAFAFDSMALALAQEAIRANADKDLEDQKRAFMYMPFMHSESKKIHEQAMELFKNLGNLEYEIKHKAIIDQFGRYPHRNKALGRKSTPQELKFLSENAGF